jgi:hypothetical protein
MFGDLEWYSGKRSQEDEQRVEYTFGEGEVVVRPKPLALADESGRTDEQFVVCCSRGDCPDWEPGAQPQTSHGYCKPRKKLVPHYKGYAHFITPQNRETDPDNFFSF